MSLTNYQVIKLSHGDNTEKKKKADDCIEKKTCLEKEMCLLWEECVIN